MHTFVPCCLSPLVLLVLGETGLTPDGRLARYPREAENPEVETCESGRELPSQVKQSPDVQNFVYSVVPSPFLVCDSSFFCTMTVQRLIGTVTKISNLKTATVTVPRHVEHPILRKVNYVHGVIELYD